MAFIYIFFKKSLKKLKKLELSFRYDVLHLLYSGLLQIFWNSKYSSWTHFFRVEIIKKVLLHVQKYLTSETLFECILTLQMTQAQI